jgi:formylglycine-generating enzyme required for sulfatase activity
MSWLVLSAMVLAAGLAQAAEASVAPGAMDAKADTAAPWPLWDGKESVADYAKRAGIKDVEMTLDLGSNVVMKLTLIPAGKFVMGDLDEKREMIGGKETVIQAGGKGPAWARPDREVTLSQPFYMGIYEVTQEQYEKVMGSDPVREGRYDAKKGCLRGKTYPESRLSWKEAADYCERLSARTGMTVWLPTEAQWEFGCRAGTTTRYPWGDNRDEWKKYVNYTLVPKGESLENAKETSGCRGEAPVGSFKPNNWGLYDMLGNAEEWCHDWYTLTYLGAPTLDPAGPGICRSGMCHVWRGGGSSSQWGLAVPVGRPLHWALPLNGFRVVVALKSASGTAPGAVNSWIVGKGDHFLKAPAATDSAAKAPGASGPTAERPADATLRVPSGCRAAAGTQAEPYTKSGRAQAIVHEATGMELVYIPAGSFLMGTPDDAAVSMPETERKHLAGEKLHRVTLTQGFYMGKCEVTQAQWEKVTGSNPSLFRNVGPEAPVETVSWDDCQAFCQKAGGGLRLPTEAEWEYACRAGTTGAYAGNLDEMGWHLGNSDGMTHPVGRKKPNAWGLHDMHGNVREWCQNAPHKYPDGDVTDPVGPDQQENRLIRGGSWADYGFFCRSAARDEYKANLFGIGRNGPNIWQNPQTPRDGYPTLGLHPDFGCRLVITANAAP